MPTRNPEIIPGVTRFGRSAMYYKRRLYKKPTFKRPEKTKVASFKVKQIGGSKNGGERKVVLHKPKKFYPTQDLPKPLPNRKRNRQTKLRSSLTPGTVVILLSGRFRGRRAVFLKQLESGLLLINGPFKLNGVPLRRVNQAYVIATSTKVDISKVEIDAKLNDKYFRRSKVKSSRKSEKKFFKKAAEKTPLSQTRVADQKAVDKAILEQIKTVPFLKSYLSSSFTLTSGQAPHELKF